MMARRVVVTGMGAISPLGGDVEASFARLKVFENCVQVLPELLPAYYSIVFVIRPHLTKPLFCCMNFGTCMRSSPAMSKSQECWPAFSTILFWMRPDRKKQTPCWKNS